MQNEKDCGILTVKVIEKAKGQEMVIYFDTETTGLCPGRIIQLSYIKESENEAIGKNFYFAVDYIEPSAQAVHGISVEKLKELSGGKTFSDYADEIEEDFKASSLVVAHNFSFDLSFMLAEFRGIDTSFRYNESFDTMKYFTHVLKLPRKSGKGYKYPKLTELTEFAEVYPYDVSRAVKNLFGEGSLSFHNACFDASAMYLTVNSMRNKLADLNEFFAAKLKS